MAAVIEEDGPSSKSQRATPPEDRMFGITTSFDTTNPVSSTTSGTMTLSKATIDTEAQKATELARRRRRAEKKLSRAQILIRSAQAAIDEVRPKSEAEIKKEKKKMKCARSMLNRAEKTLKDNECIAPRKRKNMAREMRKEMFESLANLAM
ncbi:hypothetical protein GLAREA_06039 [Glarea lozoyensis ATCC 20868]|uniref:Uncharacterized protein n=2 Tax=Glarea lozoyensis TaxID=101852 RepID=S3D3G2_GLAL2|nr:uncharacterized protein GLAREA_06039 [Glarea lozoyensis ATCC 20868]EHK99891.1 hypothetical protein M7I_4216 [Glarea lozoyensis 74030]EPE33027.1 hypothetical protein GLAREA_06039 [Glarea lozoyensis ATCC 20868]